ncbi:MAG: bifunctional phosphoribosyl-AMP cyclohydrolase/phosphoribosyl-ATP diphosphatase HisIE [Firmicutes bacterium]|nr:bifunctional phosphoribosyl-AMP cyclohydrolase/phosphoribosyl-ATP diphosphatase HisIE [Bacillota bacterium]
MELLSFTDQGLIPTIVQDNYSGQVLMLAYMNRESLQKTEETGYAWFWSRSRKVLWKKGETSGNVLKVEEIRYDCDADTLLLLVEAKGPACHTGNSSCFYRTFRGSKSGERTWREGSDFWARLQEIIKARLRERPAGSYIAGLTAGGEDRIFQKVGEEATEFLIALKNKDRHEIILEGADLFFHALLALEWSEVSWDDVLRELRARDTEKERENS